MPEKLKKLDKPTEGHKRAGEVLRFVNTIESGEPDVDKTTLEEKAGRRHIAGQKEVKD